MTAPIDLEALRGHTPGPWSTPYYDDTPGDRGWWIHNGLLGSDEFAVALTFSLNPNGEVDARLIAAAPAMLAELTTRRARDAEVFNAVAMALQHIRICAPEPTVEAALESLAPFIGANP